MIRNTFQIIATIENLVKNPYPKQALKLMEQKQVNDTRAPEEIDIEELMYLLYLIEKIEAAEEDVKTDKLILHNEVVKETSK